MTGRPGTFRWVFDWAVAIFLAAVIVGLTFIAN